MLDRRIVQEAKPVWGYLIISLFMGIGISLLAIAQARIFSQVVAGVFLEGADIKSIWKPLFFIAGMIVIRAIFQWLSEVSAHEAALYIKSNLRARLFQHILFLGPVYIREERFGALIITVVEGIESLEDYVSKYLPQLLMAALIPLLILTYIFPIDWKSGIILLVTGPLIPIFMILIGKLAKQKSLKQWENLNRMSAHFLDILQGIATLKVFNRSKDQTRVIFRVSDSFRTSTLSVLKIAFLSSLMLELCATLSTALVAVTIGLRLVNGTFTFSVGLFLLLLVPEFFTPLRTLGSSFHSGLSGVDAYRRIAEILESPVRINLDLKNNRDKLSRNEDILPDDFKIVFRNVSLAYTEGGPLSLNQINLTIQQGEKVALVGHSGAGKTSLAQILLRFVEATEGEVLINGYSIKDIPPGEWLKQIAYIPQVPHLFTGSIAENILLGRPDATMDEVIRAAYDANAHEFIAQLPNGYQTLIGERGARLSGGQAQRIAIARAILKKSPFLILDEPSSSLDPQNEYAVQQALDRLSQGKTALIISHRMSTVQQMDLIYVLDQGRIVEQGNHKTLMKAQSHYFQLFSEFRGAST